MSISSYNDPFTLLPPDIVRGIRIAESLDAVAEAMWLGDFANSVYDEYIMLFRRSKGFPDLVYVVARLSCLGYVISDLLFVATGANLNINCERVFAGLDWFGALTCQTVRFSVSCSSSYASRYLGFTLHYILFNLFVRLTYPMRQIKLSSYQHAVQSPSACPVVVADPVVALYTHHLTPSCNHDIFNTRFLPFDVHGDRSTR
ncbi:hypothetical protein ABKN59_010474 [Abortiporus biennis]